MLQCDVIRQGGYMQAHIPEDVFCNVKAVFLLHIQIIVTKGKTVTGMISFQGCKILPVWCFGV